ncbi:hypothetical protein F4553_003474 [Allocatelliglobosispora scoriae]|uniref:Uncharacterized protein n=1 Tax=Allocatelliglobosispora scoriae TaxID=643052 RepID=A0A841BQW5_9ACTN|nr:hypothetical protein [Allocatelliglobosispora scoriae]MBB5870095.1 hypothetical protein [Allocatelliglobosispora scoriae]
MIVPFAREPPFAALHLFLERRDAVSTGDLKIFSTVPERRAGPDRSRAINTVYTDYQPA